MTASGAAMAPGTRRVALRIGLVLTAAVVGILVWASVAGARSSRARAPSAAAGGVLRARLFAKVAGPAPGPFGTSLEGASFPAHGDALYFVDTTAPPGKPKILGLNLGTRRVTTTYTDSHSLLNCLVFAPQGTMYLCDLKGQRVVRFDPATRHLSTVLQGVDGVGVIPNDLAIDRAGDMYIADYRGTPTATTGRIVLRQPNGRASVLVSGLAHPNGIALTPDQNALWVTEDLAGSLTTLPSNSPPPPPRLRS